MTMAKIPPKLRRYFDHWRSAWESHWSGVRNGEPVARTDRPVYSPTREQVLEAARGLAMRSDDSRLTPDVIRLACHVVAIGEPVSSKRLTAPQMDRVVAVFDLLSGRNELAAQMRVDSSKGSPDRTRLLFAIGQVGLDDAYKAAICRDRFGSASWTGLEVPQLTQLLITLRNRERARARRNIPQEAAA